MADQTDKTPYSFKIIRRMADGALVTWYEDTEYGLQATLAHVADLAGHLTDESRPVAFIYITREYPRAIKG